MHRGPIWVGLDAGAEWVSLYAVNELSEPVRECTLPASAIAICEELDELGRGRELVIGVEAGDTAVHLTRSMRQAGHEVRILETRFLSGFLRCRQNKTDRNDARGIAEATKIGLGIIPEVFLKSGGFQALRSELVLRVQLMHLRVALANAIRAVLRLNGVKLRKTFSGTGLDECVNHELSQLRDAGTDITDILAPPLAIAVALHRTLERSGRRLARTAKSIEVCRRLMTVPGVGPICALSFYTAIEDPYRFKKNEDVGPYFGLVPKISQSGKTSRRGRITKRGNTMTRTHLVSAAKSLLQQSTRDCELRRWAMALADRSERSKARVALARKLAIVMIAMWKSGQVFSPEGGKNLAPRGVPLAKQGP